MPPPGHSGLATPPSSGAVFREALRSAYDGVISAGLRDFVAGTGPQDRERLGLHSMDQIGRIAAQAKEWVDNVFGHFTAGPALVPDRPGEPGDIYDRYVYVGELIKDKDEAELREYAAGELRDWLYSVTEIADVLEEHGADPDYTGGAAPAWGAAAADEVIGDILSKQENVRSVLQIWQGWPAEARPGAQEVWFQTVRSPAAEGNQVYLWDAAQLFIRQYVSRLAHPDYTEFVSTLGPDADGVLRDGVASLLTEVVWSEVSPLASDGDDELRQVIEGDYAREPELGSQMPSVTGLRYPGYDRAMELLRAVGDVRKLYAAYFLGEVEKIARAARSVLTGFPADEPASRADLEAAGPADAAGLAVRHLAGDPQTGLDAPQQHEDVLLALLDGDADHRELALLLLWAADNELIDRWLDHRRPLPDRLLEISADDPLRAGLDEFLRLRLRGGRDALEEGWPEAEGRPRLDFRPELLNDWLDKVKAGREPERAGSGHGHRRAGGGRSWRGDRYGRAASQPVHGAACPRGPLADQRLGAGPIPCR